MGDLMPKRTAPVGGRCEHCGSSGHSERDALRCDCGSMLARHVAGGIELKCRRCKRIVVVPISDAGSD